ncbi:MAG: ABC transporter permease [Acidobacteriota bacterium]|nr:ABC transporter permease [Acidobacteriota bacterium]
MTMNMGINPKNAVLTKSNLRQAGYSSDVAEHFQRQLLEKVWQIPGVEAAGYASNTPLINVSTSAVFSQQITDFRPSNKAFDQYDYKVSPGYFAAAGTPMLAGRDVSFADTAKRPAVVIVNQEFARRLSPSDRGHSEQVVGRYFKDNSGRLIQIVGMVADEKNISLSEEPQPAAFFPILQAASTATALVIRTRRETADMVTIVRKVVHDLDPGVPIEGIGRWNNQLGMSFFPAQVATIALGRMLIPLASGSAVGMLLGAAASRVLSAIVYQASAQDPFVLIAVC